MQKKYSLIIVLFLLLSSISLRAQETWTLEKCIKYAFDNNIQIKQQMLNVNMSEGKLLQSKLNNLPSLNASASQYYTYGRAVTDQNSVSQDVANTSTSISASLTLFDGLQKLTAIQQNRYNHLASVSDVDKIRNSVALNIASAYLQILYSDELVATANRQLDLSKMQVERTKLLVKAGSLPEGNLLEIEAQEASDELQLITAQNQLEIAYLNLTQLLDIKTPDGFKILKPELAGFESKIVTITLGEVFQTALLSMPQIMSANYRVSSAEKELTVVKGSQYPTLTLNSSYSSRAQKFIKDNYYDPNPTDGIDESVLWKDPSLFNQIKDKASFSVGFNLSIPIFNGWQIRNGISNAKISLNNSRLNLEYEKNVLFKDIQQAYTDALAAQKKLKATQKSLKALEEAFRYSEQKFNVGMVTSVDYTTAKTKLSKAETDLLQAKYELIFKSKILEFYKGVPLSL